MLTIDINGKPKDRSALNNMIDPNYLEQIKQLKDTNQVQDVLPAFNPPDILNDDDPYYSKITKSPIHDEGFVAQDNVEYKDGKLILKQIIIDYDFLKAKLIIKNEKGNINVDIDTIKSIEFNDCKFTVSIDFLFQEDKKLIIDDCVIESNQHINHNGSESNKLQITSFDMRNSTIEKDFSFYWCDIKNIVIDNCDFESLSEFNNVTFENIVTFTEITYKGLTLFDKCVFKTFVSFKYIVFEKLTFFRGSNFCNGLNLDYTSSNSEINFYDINGLGTPESKEQTSQETYRIIKHNFEKLGNKIEANKYHAFELEQKRRKLEREKPRKWQEYLVFKLHDLSSEHSTNWFRVLLWLIIIASTTTALLNTIWALVLFPLFILIYFLSEVLSSRVAIKLSILATISFIIVCFDVENVFQNISLINLTNSNLTFIGIPEVEELTSWQKIVTFFNKISLGYLYYQFLMSVRKDTRK